MQGIENFLINLPIFSVPSIFSFCSIITPFTQKKRNTNKVLHFCNLIIISQFFIIVKFYLLFFTLLFFYSLFSHHLIYIQIHLYYFVNALKDFVAKINNL
jgi:hypothetical protein